MARTVTLDDLSEDIARHFVESGQHPTVEAVVAAALGVLADADPDLTELRRLIAEGEASEDDGEWDQEAFLKRAHARLEGRSAAE